MASYRTPVLRHSMISLLAIILLFIIAIPVLSADEPPVGWCTFYPGVDVGSDQIGNSGASVLSVCSGGWGMWQNEAQIDWSPLDKQIELAVKNNLSLALISESNPVYSPVWLKDKVKAAGQNVFSSGGAAGDIPSITSPIFREAHDNLIKQFIEHVKQVDTNHVVKYYHPGCEWWFMHSYRYNEADIAQFRNWLQKKYKTIGTLNKRWESKYKSFNDVPAPKLDTVSTSNKELGKIMASDIGEEHCSWSIGASTNPDTDKKMLAIIEPGKTYEMSVWIKTKDIKGPGAFLEVAWVRESGGAPISGGSTFAVNGTGDWRKVSTTLKTPTGAARAWLLMKFTATGTAWYDDVDIHEVGSSTNLAPNPGFENGQDAWSFQNWSNGKNVSSAHRDTGGRNNSGCMEVTVKPVTDNPLVYRNPDAAVNDWTNFWYEAAAEYINSLAGVYKKYDPATPTVTYLTFSFGYPAEWDYSQQMSISPDEVAARGSNIDAYGMQICSADGDPYRATANLDLVRKYDKPMWAVDLVDFTSGVYIGYPKMDKITQSVIQHGAKGIIYCLWHLPPVIDYSFYPNMDIKDINKMLTDARSSIKLIDGMKVNPDVALVLPILPASSQDTEGSKNYFKSFMGWYKILENMQVTFDVVTLKEIEKGTDLKKYKWVMLPDCAYIPEKALKNLTAYTKASGKLTSAGRFAQLNDIARPLPANLAASCTRTKLPDYGKSYSGELIRDTHAGNTPPLFLWRADTSVTEKAFTDAKGKLTGIIKSANVKSKVDILPYNKSLRCVIHEDNDHQAMYIVNMGDSTVPAGKYRVQIGATSNVEVYADTKSVKPISKDSYVVLPEFNSSCIVMFDKKKTGK
ncbi:MAG: beta-galactosidase [Armatimonadota bacterium]